MLILLIVFSNTFAFQTAKIITQAMQSQMTPQDALNRLIAGNNRFIDNQRTPVDYLKKARLTANGQYPAAIVLSCIDSRVPPEILFDQNIGNIYVTRVAANVINKDVLGGMEYATAVTHAKLIVVMGHDSCGAIKGACQNVALGNLTQLLFKIQPAISQAKKTMGKQDCNNKQFINLAAEDNVKNIVELIPKESPVIAKLIQEHKVEVVGAMYDLDTGKVRFLQETVE